MAIKATIGLILLMLGTMSTVSSQAENSWKTWSDIRWHGLEQFSKGNFPDAIVSFKKALTEARRVQSSSENAAISTYDLAQAYKALGDNKKTEDYCNDALCVAQKVCPHSGLQTLVLLTLAGVRRDANNLDQVQELNNTIVKMNKEDPETQCIAQAEMRPNGEIEVKAYSEPHTYTITPVSDPKYRDLLMHIGPLRPEHPRPVIQWSKEETKL